MAEESFPIPRCVGVCIQIDTNSINAKRKLECINQLEKWQNNGVIHIEMSKAAQNEILKESSDSSRVKDRRSRALDYMYADACILTPTEFETLKKIETIVFPSGAITQKQKNDVEIVFTAWKYKCILVTNDGGSKSQPKGILGSANELKKIGVIVMRDSKAVEHIRSKIQERDSAARRYVRNESELPPWVGKD